MLIINLILTMLLICLFYFISPLNIELFNDKNWAKGIAKEIQSNLSNSGSLQSDDSVCLKKNTDKSDFYEAFKYLKTELLDIRLEIDSLKKHIDLIDKKTQEISNQKNVEKTRENFTKALSKNTAVLSGDSPEKTQNMLNSYYKNPPDPNEVAKTYDKPDEKEIAKKNKKNANKLDKLLNNLKSNNKEYENIKNNYLDSSSIDCKCKDDKQRTPDQKHSLGEVLLMLANNLGFSGNSSKINKECSKNDKECQKKITDKSRNDAIKILQNLSSYFNCDISNLSKGFFPYTLEKITS